MSGADHQTQAIAPNSAVTLHYRLTLEDGTEVDSTFGGEPLTFSMGDGTLIQGLEQVLLGLIPGARHTFVLGAEQAFGWRDTENIHDLPSSEFGPELTPEPGSVLVFTTPGGDEIPGMILSVDEENVRVDFNHPLAGHAITFDVEIIATTQAAN